MSHLQPFIFIILLASCDSLKIAISEASSEVEENGNGEGLGSGSAQPMTQSQRTALSDATSGLESQASPGSPQESTVNTPSGQVRAKVVKDTVAQFQNGKNWVTTADTSSGLTATTEVTISATAATSIVQKVTAGMPTGATLAEIETVVSVPSAATGDGLELIVKGCDNAGACTTVDVTSLSTCVEFELPKEASTDTFCGFVDVNNVNSLLTTGVTTTADQGSTLTCCTTHATTFKSGGSGGSGGSATGDPKATNLNGQRFEILQLGTFSLLSVSEGVAANRLSLDATIDRAGEMCGATYIKNITMAGSWMEKPVRVRAAPAEVKLKALEVAFDGEEWIKTPMAQEKSPQVSTADQKNIHFDVHGVQIKVSIDAHRVRKNGVKTGSFANFLNVNVNGLQTVRASGANLGGLLAYDDHSFAMTAPDECKKGKLANLKQKLQDSLESPETTDFLSSMFANE